MEINFRNNKDIINIDSQHMEYVELENRKNIYITQETTAYFETENYAEDRNMLLIEEPVDEKMANLRSCDDSVELQEEVGSAESEDYDAERSSTIEPDFSTSQNDPLTHTYEELRNTFEEEDHTCDEESDDEEEDHTCDEESDDLCEEDEGNDDDDDDDDDDDEFAEDVFDSDEDEDDNAEEDDELDEVAEEFEPGDLDDDNEHWYNGPRNGQYVWVPHASSSSSSSSDDETKGTKGKYVWQPAAAAAAGEKEKPKEIYWGNRKKHEEWVPQPTTSKMTTKEQKNKEKEKKKKRWMPRLVASKESGKTVWYYKLPSTTKTNNAKKESLRHIPKLIKEKGSNDWFSQIVSTKNKKKKTVWYCKLTPIDEEQPGIAEKPTVNNAVQQTSNDLPQGCKSKTIKPNQEKAHVATASKISSKGESSGSGSEISRNGLENSRSSSENSRSGLENLRSIIENSRSGSENSQNQETVSRETLKKSNKAENSAIGLQDPEEQAAKNESTTKPSRSNEMRSLVQRPTSPVPENSIPKLIQIQIWKDNPTPDELTKPGSTLREVGARPPRQQRDSDAQIDNCLFQLPMMTKSLIDDEKSQKPTAIWYEDVSADI